MTVEDGEGLSESLVRALLHLRERIALEALDRLWIFPVLSGETRETGVMVVSCFGPDPRIRILHTLTFRRLKGKPERGEEPFRVELEEEGTVPVDRVSRIIVGVSRRLGEEDPGEPREVVVEGRSTAFDALLPEEPAPHEPITQPETEKP